LTFAANLRLHRLSCAEAGSGLMLQNINVLPWPPRQGYTQLQQQGREGITHDMRHADSSDTRHECAKLNSLIDASSQADGQVQCRRTFQQQGRMRHTGVTCASSYCSQLHHAQRSTEAHLQ
jgi:hypothetical protein